MNKEIKIPAIEKGVVIDHIPSQTALKMIRTLKITDGCELRIGVNLDSRKLGLKDVVKVESHKLSKKELNKITLFAPDATVSIIEDYKVKEKIQLEVPDVVENILSCANPNCITRHDPVKTKFHLASKKPLILKCHFCEKSFNKEDLEIV